MAIASFNCWSDNWGIKHQQDLEKSYNSKNHSCTKNIHISMMSCCTFYIGLSQTEHYTLCSRLSDFASLQQVSFWLRLKCLKENICNFEQSDQDQCKKKSESVSTHLGSVFLELALSHGKQTVELNSFPSNMLIYEPVNRLEQLFCQERLQSELSSQELWWAVSQRGGGEEGGHVCDGSLGLVQTD